MNSATCLAWPLGGLAVLGAALWCHDLHWTAQWEDAAPALAALPLMWWLGRPWRLRSEPAAFPRTAAAASAVLLAAGVAAGLLVVAAAGWCGLLACTLWRHVAWEAQRPWTRLLPLALLGFPWLAFDAVWLGWCFRYSGAMAAEAVLTALQMEVTREGTQMYTAGCCISVGEACSGLRGLQAMLIGGVVVAWQTLGSSRHYWWHLPLLATGAWLANTLRIVVTGIGVRWLPVSWLQGDAHLWQGWLLLCLTFAGCLAAMRLLDNRGVEASS